MAEVFQTGQDFHTLELSWKELVAITQSLARGMEDPQINSEGVAGETWVTLANYVMHKLP